MRVLVTRPEPDATAQADMLRSCGLTPVLAPLLSVTLHPLPRMVATRVPAYAAVIATSRNALRSLERHGCPPALKSVPLYCVGPATSALATALGFATVIRGDGDAEALRRTLSEDVNPEVGPILRLTGETPSAAPERLDTAMRDAGYVVETVICYEIEACPSFSPGVQSALSSGAIDLVVLMSPLTARTYVAACENATLTIQSDKPSYLCLSQAVADVFGSGSQSRMFIADKPNQSALRSVIDQAVAELS